MVACVIWFNRGDNMTTSKANQRAVNKYIRNNYDRFEIVLPRGSKKALKRIAEARTDGSVNELIKQAITMYCPEWIRITEENRQEIAKQETE
jgi:hypothetical protein